MREPREPVVNNKPKIFNRVDYFNSNIIDFKDRFPAKHSTTTGRTPECDRQKGSYFVAGGGRIDIRFQRLDQEDLFTRRWRNGKGGNNLPVKKRPVRSSAWRWWLEGKREYRCYFPGGFKIVYTGDG
ncbi:hypothetical protein TNCT_283761 [Trichonephila clavata]|uniref:Uncharacterized protein n=1 Tax=Trichonephila clavata TaxID=2740835 RepID=A0A8X6LRM5_TRICU|nr:hypothetical protein TNCT_283761 [Trichonephila clavata]